MLKLIATICGITGSALVASNMGFQSLGYAFFICCSYSYAYVNVMSKDKQAAFLWIYFSMMDTYGFIRYL